MVETVGSDQIKSLTEDMKKFATFVKSAKSTNKDDPHTKELETKEGQFAELVGKMVPSETVVAKFDALRKALTEYMRTIPATIKKIAPPEGPKGPVDVGIGRLAKSEDAIKKLKELQKGDLAGKIVLKDGDKEHPDSTLWQFDGSKGSLPTTAHTKGPGGKNEKAALVELKKVFKAAGYL